MEQKLSQKKKLPFFERIFPYLCIAPTLIGLFIFAYIAMGRAAVNSLTDYTWGFKTNFVGLKNYVHAFRSEIFMQAFRNQVFVVLARVFNPIFWPLLASELLFFVRTSRLKNIMKRLFVIPMLVPGIVNTMIWKYLYNPNYGFDNLLNRIGMTNLAKDWLNDPSTAMFAVLFAGFPFVSGLYFLIMHTGLDMVDREIYDAAIIDGATSLQVVYYIHLPNMVQYARTIATLSLIGALGEYASIAALTGGGPGFATTLPALVMYRKAFSDGEFGAASAMGMIIMIEILIFTLIFRKLSAMKEA